MLTSTSSGATKRLDLTVLDVRLQNRPYADLWVLVEGGDGQRWSGRTDRHGQLTLSDPELIAPVDVHVFGPCIEYSSVLDVDRSIILIAPRWVVRADVAECALDRPRPPPAAREQAHGLLSGQVVLPGGWDALPKPRQGERRMVHVEATYPVIRRQTPPESLVEYWADIVESEVPDAERLEFSFRAPATVMAVYAVAGIEDDTDGTFLPYAMGATRRVAIAPGQDRGDLEIAVDIPLDRELQVDVSPFPRTSRADNASLELIAVLDFGAEGVMQRVIGENLLDHVLQVDDTRQQFWGRPGPAEALRDARLRVRAEWSGERRRVTAQQLFPLDRMVVEFEPQLGTPELVTPDAHSLTAERTLEWNIGNESVEPDVQRVGILVDGIPAWAFVAPGSRRKIKLPDPSEVDASLADPLVTATGVEIEAERGSPYRSYQGRFPLGTLIGQHWDNYVALDTRAE